MRWLLLAMVVLVARYAGAGVCTGVPDGAQCLLSDNATAGMCAGGACTRTFTVPAGEARTGTGTVSAIGSGNTVTGSGTAFLSELQVGDILLVSGQRVAVISISSNTSLTSSPGLSPAVPAGTAFTYVNPIARWLDSSGNTVAVLDFRGFLGLGIPYTSGPFAVQGPTETSAGAGGQQIYMQAGQGGPASSTQLGGSGGQIQLIAGEGGNSAIAGKLPGTGATGFLGGGVGGATSVPGDPDGAGGPVWITGGSGGYGGSGTGAAGGVVRITGGDASNGSGPASVNVCDTGGTVKFGSAQQTQLNCATGAFTKIRGITVSNVPAAVNAFAQANAGGL